MAKIVMGAGTSHSPMLSMPWEQWSMRGENDKKAESLVQPETGDTMNYAELLRRRGAKPVNKDIFKSQWEQLQHGIEVLAQTFREVKPDVLVIISDDQEELLFDDNMPMFQIYWGDKIRLLPRYISPTGAADMRTWVWGYGDVEMDIPVNAELGRHLIEYLRDAEFDIAYSRYLNKDHSYGGTVGPSGYISKSVTTPPRPQGLGHGWGFVVKRLLDNKPIPMVPVVQNTCYPPNTPTAKRCYKLGKALRAAIESWPSDQRVAVVASGGLSHFVTDEEVDRLAIKGMLEKDGNILSNLPESRLQSAASEIKNWITCSAACEGLKPELIDYVPVYRSEAGTGGGWGFMRWLS